MLIVIGQWSDRFGIKSSIQITNTYGKNILELCIGSQLRILNGRTIGDSSGKATYFNYNGVTINDYCW
jgi:hypothetical protein